MNFRGVPVFFLPTDAPKKPTRFSVVFGLQVSSKPHGYWHSKATYKDNGQASVHNNIQNTWEGDVAQVGKSPLASGCCRSYSPCALMVFLFGVNKDVFFEQLRLEGIKLEFRTRTRATHDNIVFCCETSQK